VNLADEPTVISTRGIHSVACELLANLVRGRRKALLFATHNRFVADACDCVHEMKDGRVVTTHPHGQRISV
jgi:ABC-type lipoprotein export system ATPase subunit